MPDTFQRAHAGNDAHELIRRFSAGRPTARGRVRLELPDIAVNGNSIHMTVSVDRVAAAYLTDVLVVADGNSRARLAAFQFAPASEISQVATRIRLQATQSVTTVAKMSDGNFYIASKRVKVALGGSSW
jgi:sulfur-oxidizing protein SoxY